MTKKTNKKAPKQPLKDTIAQQNENGSRRAILEDLFYDFHRSRRQIYLMNMVRGIFFGVGSTLGATIVVAMIVWIVSQFTGIFPELNELLKTINRK